MSENNEETITLVTPGAAALASFNAKNFENNRDALIEKALNGRCDGEDAVTKIGEEEEKRYDAVKQAQLKARARVMEEKRKAEMRLAKEENTKNEETFAAPKRNVLKEKIRLNVHQKNKDKTKEKKNKIKNGLEMVSHVLIPYETTKENKDTIQKSGMDIGATCICALPSSLSVACGRENGCVDIGFAKGELNVQRRMNPTVPQQRLELNKVCENCRAGMFRGKRVDARDVRFESIRSTERSTGYIQTRRGRQIARTTRIKESKLSRSGDFEGFGGSLFRLAGVSRRQLFRHERGVQEHKEEEEEEARGGRKSIDEENAHFERILQQIKEQR